MTATPNKLPTIFTQIWNEEVPSYYLYRFDCGDGFGVMAFLDIHPATPGHVLVISQEATERWTDANLSPVSLHRIVSLGQLVGRRQLAVLAHDKPPIESVHASFYGDDVPQVHYHVIPSYVRGVAIERMQSSSGRMQEPVDKGRLEEMRQRLAFPAELAEAVDDYMRVLGALAAALPISPELVGASSGAVLLGGPAVPPTQERPDGLWVPPGSMG